MRENSSWQWQSMVNWMLFRVSQMKSGAGNERCRFVRQLWMQLGRNKGNVSTGATCNKHTHTYTNVFTNNLHTALFLWYIMQLTISPHIVPSAPLPGCALIAPNCSCGRCGHCSNTVNINNKNNNLKSNWKRQLFVWMQTAEANKTEKYKVSWSWSRSTNSSSNNGSNSKSNNNNKK